MVSTLLHQRLGVAPTLIEQPELVVALGSVLAAMPPRTAPFPQGPPPPPGPRPPMMGVPIPQPGPRAPVQPPNAPVSGPVGMPVSGPGLPSGPVTPVSPAAFQSPAAPMSPPTSAPPNQTARFGAAPPMGPQAPMGPIAPPYAPVPPRPNGGSGSRVGLLVIIVAACVLLLGVGGAVAWNAVSDDKPDTGNTGNAGSGNRAGSGDGTGTGGDTAATKNAKPGASQQTVDVNKSVWYAQFKVTVNKMTYDAKAESHQLSAEVVVENLGTDNDTPYLPTIFNAGGQQYTGSFRESTTVAAGQKSNYNIDFSIYDPLKVSIATGELIFGDGDREQAKNSLASGDVVA
jgi:hypothetical protein